MSNESSKIICNRRTRLITSNWDFRAQDDIQSGRGFRITEDGKSDTNTEAGLYSIHSPLYGTDYHDEHSFEDRYSCNCGTYTGKNFNGFMCPKCKSKVKFIDVDITVTGWIILDREVVINPIYYKKLRTFIGTKIFPEILKFKEPHDRDPENASAGIYDGLGCIEFHERFDEIMMFYLKKNRSNQKKRELFFFIMSRRNQVFTHSIPVYSSHLRPFVIRGTEIKYSDDDKLFKHIFTNSKMLNDKYELERKITAAKKKRNINSVQYLRKENILFSIQSDLDKLWNSSFELIKKKTGIIRDKILGGRLDMSARNVIVPDKDLRPDEIKLGYTTFLELYKLEIISILVNMLDIDHPKAWNMWKDATINFNEQIYKVMQYMVKNRNIICEINRNPTINYGSILVMKVKEVIPDINDYTMSLPESVLTLLNADLKSGSKIA